MRKYVWRCLNNVVAFSGSNQAHNLTNISYSWRSFQTCCWRGHLPGCFNDPTSYFHWCSFNLFSKRSCLHTACLLICVLPAAFKKFCSNKRWPVTGTSLARTATHLEQTWAIERLLPGLHAQKKRCFVLDSWWIIKKTTEHCATRANSKMRPEALLMHHDLRFGCFLTDMRGLCKVGLRLKEGRALKASESSHHKNHWSCSVHQKCL